MEIRGRIRPRQTGAMQTPFHPHPEQKALDAEPQSACLSQTPRPQQQDARGVCCPRKTCASCKHRSGMPSVQVHLSKTSRKVLSKRQASTSVLRLAYTLTVLRSRHTAHRYHTEKVLCKRHALTCAQGTADKPSVDTLFTLQ